MKKRKGLVAVVLALVVLLCGVFAGCGKDVGTICALEEAYAQGLISTEDLKSIAYYYNLGRAPEDLEEDETFTPKPKDSEELNSEIEEKIKKAYINDIRDVADNTSRDDLDLLWSCLSITGYYGTYNETIVVRIKDKSILAEPTVSDKAYVIGGIGFYQYHGELFVWSN